MYYQWKISKETTFNQSMITPSWTGMIVQGFSDDISIHRLNTNTQHIDTIYTSRRPSAKIAGIIHIWQPRSHCRWRCRYCCRWRCSSRCSWLCPEIRGLSSLKPLTNFTVSLSLHNNIDLVLWCRHTKLYGQSPCPDADHIWSQFHEIYAQHTIQWICRLVWMRMLLVDRQFESLWPPYHVRGLIGILIDICYRSFRIQIFSGRQRFT